MVLIGHILVPVVPCCRSLVVVSPTLSLVNAPQSVISECRPVLLLVIPVLVHTLP